MSNVKNSNKVVQSNSLVQQTNWKLNQTQLKLFKVLVSCIDTDNPPKKNIIEVSKTDLVRFMDGEETKNHDFYHNHLRALQTSVKVGEDEKKIVSVSLVTKVEWYKNDDLVKVHFHDDVMPFLIHLNNNFLQYQVANLNLFKSKYSLIIYEYLLSWKRKKPELNSFYITIDDLRYLTATTKKYSNFKDFDNKVLKTSKNEINGVDPKIKYHPIEILIDYEKVKKGTKIIGINFKVRTRAKGEEKEY